MIEARSYNTEDESVILPDCYGMGLVFIQNILIEFGKKRKKENMMRGLKGPFPIIPPGFQIEFNGENVGLLSYQQRIPTVQENSIEYVLESLLNLNEKIDKIFS